MTEPEKKRIPRAPGHLVKEGRKFWRQVLKEIDLEEAHVLKLLESACQCLDRVQEARLEIEAKGSFYRDRFGQPKEHPAHKTERDNKVLFARLVRELGLDFEPQPGSRPPRQY